MMAQRYFDLRDPVNQAATIGLYGQVPPPATPQLNHVSADRTYITWMSKTNLAPMRDQGKSCLCAAASGVSDGSRPPATGLQEQVANRHKRLWLRAMVVSVMEKVL